MVKLFDFFASWCPPCQQMRPIVEELAKEFEGRAEFEKIDVDREGGKAGKYSVLSVPTFVLEKDGKEADRIVGARSKEEFRKWIEKHL